MTQYEPSPTVDFSVFQQLDVRVGRITGVEIAEGCRVAAYKLELDFGPEIGTRRRIAQATNYPRENLVGRQVLAVVNFKPRQVGKHISEVLVLGVPTKDKGTALVVPEMEATLGGRLF
ncbi:MAG TPA: tRNA-binding protein [Candidatus Angelobacter sp.]|jgi:tRNA-binding protein|nr:tRNA-binding protein [Candidatus Angelobacter sp.]